jgi:hypothetical protein
MKLSLLQAAVGLFLVTGPAHPRFDVFERFFASDLARYAREAREANATHGAGWSLSTGKSCEDASAEDPEAIVLEDPWFALGEDTFGRAVATSDFMSQCEMPEDAKVEICVAIKDGAVRGVTTHVVSATDETARCIDRGVRALRFPVAK